MSEGRAPGESRHLLRTAALTTFAMTGFAANSLLCRGALGGRAVDPAAFAALRLASGALVLWGLASVRGRGNAARRRGRLARAAMLSLYAIAFSFAYVSLGAGTGALILFAAVQATMMIAALAAGERPHPLQWIGLVVGLAGFVELVLPGLTAPSLGGSALMGAAGLAWGVYSLLGREAGDPLAATAESFACSAPAALAVVLLTMGQARMSWRGALLAIASGAVASGLGYVAWYAALARLDTTRAAAVQLSVPVLAAAGGVLFLSETITTRLVLAAVAILGGVGLALRGRGAARRPAPEMSGTGP